MSRSSVRRVTTERGEVFCVGDEIEFWSAEGGGCWKPGVVVRLSQVFLHDADERCRNNSGFQSHVRIRVGDMTVPEHDGVYVVRAVIKCRLHHQGE